MLKMRCSFLLGFLFIFAAARAEEEIDMDLLQCLVCRATIEEVEGVINKIDPSKDIEIGNYRLDAKGNVIRKKVPLKQSEVHLSEVLDNICEKLSDYARARYKSDGRLTLLKLMSPTGGLNPEMSNVDIIQDGDLNKSLKFYCEEIVEEHEEPIIEVFQQDKPNIINEICTKTTQICSDEISEDDDFPETDEDSESEHEEL